MSTKKALALVLVALTLFGVAGAAMAAPHAVVLGAGSSINVGGSTPVLGQPAQERFLHLHAACAVG